jgi:hypothetical protein
LICLEGHDIQEINSLNHYIGIRHIDRSEFTDSDCMPLVIGTKQVANCWIGYREAWGGPSAS